VTLRRKVETVNESRYPSLEERVERLERTTEQLRHELRGTDRSRAGKASDVPPGLPSTSSKDGGGAREETVTGSGGSSDSEWSFGTPLDLGNLGNLRSGEWWLNKVGIGLLLFGVAFLFLFSIERGWISPPMRVGFGLGIGAALLTIGLRVYEDRRAFSQVLLGGGVGTLYITGFAAFQLYALVPYQFAFAFMLAVTLLAGALSLRQDGAPLSIIGALGGLGTPFVLYDGTGSLGGLVLYTCLILAGMVTVYFYKGWASLLGVSFVGGWLVFLICYGSNFASLMAPSSGDRWTLQFGIIFTWLLFWLVPAAREILLDSGRRTAHLYTVSTPTIALGFTALIWRLPSSDFGLITLSGAALYTFAALALWRLARNDLSYTHALVALLLLTCALVLMLEGDTLFFTLAAEAATLHLVARRFSDRIISAGAHLLFAAAALWLAVRLVPEILGNFSDPAYPVLFNARALVDLAVIALAFGVPSFVLPRGSDLVYRGAAHAALLTFLWRELSALPDGYAWVTVSWGLYAVALLVAGLRLDRGSLVRGGMITLFLVVGKLFLVDLSEVEPLWRTFLFLGFGSLFLALSYYLRSLWRPGAGRGRTQRSGAARDHS
jgi:Predicted membrane protein (DUF2339)